MEIDPPAIHPPATKSAAEQQHYDLFGTDSEYEDDAQPAPQAAAQAQPAPAQAQPAALQPAAQAQPAAPAQEEEEVAKFDPDSFLNLDEIIDGLMT